MNKLASRPGVPGAVNPPGLPDPSPLRTSLAEAMEEFVAYQSAHPPDEKSRALELKCLALAAADARERCDYLGEAGHYDRMAVLREGSPDSAAELLAAGHAYRCAGSLSAAIERMDHAAAAAAELGEISLHWQARAASADLIAEHLGRPEQALAVVGEAIVGLKDQPKTELHARALLTRTRLLWSLRRLDEAERSATEVIELGKGDLSDEGVLLCGMIRVRVDFARRLAGDAISGAKQLAAAGRDSSVVGELLEHLGSLFLECGDHGLARVTYDQAIEAFDRIDDRLGRARVELGIARLFVEEGRWQAAEAPLALAEGEFDRCESLYWATYASLIRVEVLLGHGSVLEAEKLLASCRASAPVPCSLHFVARYHEMAGDVDRKAKRHDAALIHYIRGRDVARQAGLTRDYARAALNCAHMYLATGQPALAETQATLAGALAKPQEDVLCVEYVEAKLARARVQQTRRMHDSARALVLEALEAADHLLLLDQVDSTRVEVILRDLRRMESLVS